MTPRRQRFMGDLRAACPLRFSHGKRPMVKDRLMAKTQHQLGFRS